MIDPIRRLAERLVLVTQPYQRHDAYTDLNVLLADRFEHILRHAGVRFGTPMPVEMAGVKLSTMINLKRLAANHGMTLEQVVSDRWAILDRAKGYPHHEELPPCKHCDCVPCRTSHNPWYPQCSGSGGNCACPGYEALEGGEQAVSKSGDTGTEHPIVSDLGSDGDRLPDRDHRPAAPDPIHETEAKAVGDFAKRMHENAVQSPSTIPIHEVNDETSPTSDRGSTDCAPDRAHCDPSHRVVRPLADERDSATVTGVYVTAGEIVQTWREGGGPLYKVLWENSFGKLTVERQDTKSIVDLNYSDCIYTTDGRPVLGYRERPSSDELEQRCYAAEARSKEWCEQVGDLKLRIAELESRLAAEQTYHENSNDLLRNVRSRLGVPMGVEITTFASQLVRERDEALADRDLYMRRLVGDPCQGWVRLDDETIERVVDVVYDTRNMGASHKRMHEQLRRALRDLRDGKLNFQDERTER